MRRFRLHAFGFIMSLVLALLKVVLVNFTLNEYMMMSIGLQPPFLVLRASTRPATSIHSMRWRCSIATSYKDASPW